MIQELELLWCEAYQAQGATVRLHGQLDNEWGPSLMSYDKEWRFETAYSTLKMTFGESIMINILENIIKKLSAKAFIYNMQINL